ncbi:MAG: hypothetical protein J2P46_13360, partial [Zavarzinella sp.]|nr:hypothetical protein [Zavarzinella sp.]
MVFRRLGVLRQHADRLQAGPELVQRLQGLVPDLRLRLVLGLLLQHVQGPHRHLAHLADVERGHQ